MLLMAVMVLVPVADAVSCSLESAASHPVEPCDDHEAGSDETGARHSGDHDAVASTDDCAADRAHGACAHNHCHHTMAHVPSGVATGQRLPEGDDGTSFKHAARLENRADGLMRPPRG